MLQLPAALAVDVSWQSGGVMRLCVIHQLLHSTTKAHSVALGPYARAESAEERQRIVAEVDEYLNRL